MGVDKKTCTYAEYSAFIDRPENEGRIFELIDGEIVEKMPSFTPSYISLRMATELNLYLRQNPTGRISSEAGGYILSEDDVLIPDVGYISKERMSEFPRREAPIAPNLAIAVKSPGGRKNKMRLKAEKYLAPGTRIVPFPMGAPSGTMASWMAATCCPASHLR